MYKNETSSGSMKWAVEENDLQSAMEAESCKTREKRFTGLPRSCFIEVKQYDRNMLPIHENETSSGRIKGVVEVRGTAQNVSITIDEIPKSIVC